MRHIIAVADVCHLQPREILALILTDREEIGERLARMQEVTERVDHGHIRPLRKLLDALMSIRADHNAVKVA